ncbi:hypothetical protein ACWKSP_26565 [Micromonosporaceae bacterium Da 78-11]
MTEAKPYDLQRIYAEKTGGPFRFTWADQVWTMPSMLMLDIELQERIENIDTAATSVDTLNTLFDELMGDEQGARWREVSRPLPMLMDMFQAWTEHSKAALGESAASAGSSKSTGRPSSRTSNASTKSGSPAPSSRRGKRTVTPPVNS